MLRLLGLEGADELDVPLANVLVDHVFERGKLERGIAYWVGNATMVTELGLEEMARTASPASSTSAPCRPPTREPSTATWRGPATRAWTRSRRRCRSAGSMRERIGERPAPHRYVLTATGNVYEDVVHARAVADHGGDIVAVIRSTAQCLLDYVPYGATTEGFGGTFATQANFRIMREALDDWTRRATAATSASSSFCSGPLHAGDRRPGRPRGPRQHGQRRPLRHPLPRHQHRSGR